MKKKIISVLVVVLIVALACSLAACDTSMFDGSYRKEASDEQARSAWTSARVAFGADTASIATASGSVDIKGWTGMKFSMDKDVTVSGTYDGESGNSSLKLKSDGAALFDGSAMAVTGSYSNKTTTGKNKVDRAYNVGMYSKDDTLYNSIEINDTSLKVQFPLNGLSVLKTEIARVTNRFVTDVYFSIGSPIYDWSYDEFIEDFAGIKVYVNDSGKYVRVKYSFTAEAVVELFDYNFDDDFLTAANLDDCSLIIVTDKDGVFQGAKMTFNFSYNSTANGNNISMTAKSVASIENCSEVKSLPSDLDDYKTVTQINLDDALTLVRSILYFS